MAIPKISLGSKTKRNYFDKSHNYNGTSEFGFCLPTLYDEVEANTTVHLKTNTFVRLGILPQPSFAPVTVKQYNNYIPVHDVFEAYDYMCSQQTVQSAIAQYVPNKIDCVKSFSHLLLGIIMSDMASNLELHHYHIGIPCFWRVMKADSAAPVTILNGDFVSSDLAKIHNYLRQGFGHTISIESKTFGYNSISDNANFGKSLYDIGQQSIEPAYVKDLFPNISRYLYISPSFDNADFVFRIGEYTNDSDLYLTFHLTHEGKRLFKILQCIGYQFKYDKEVMITPLLAYYKAWFDTFNPHRNVQWRQTYAYKLIHGYYDTGVTLSSAFSASSDLSHYNTFDLFFRFLRELPRCCYTLAIDPITVAQNTPVEGATQSYSLLNYDTSSGNVQIRPASSRSLEGSITGGSSLTSQISAYTIRMLDKLAPMLNKNSVIGARVDKFMQLHYGTHLPDSYNFGKDSMNINVSDVFSTADTTTSHGEGSYLGEYAGRGTGYNNGGKHDFTANRNGYIFQFTCIIPIGNYSQSLNPLLCNLDKNSRYLAEFDGLGMAPLTKSSVFGSESVFFDRASADGTFGFVPRLMEYKYKFNVRAGGFINRSERANFMPYQLDRFFTESEVSVEKYTSKDKVIKQLPVDVRCDESLRYIGNNEDFGNYNRIFLDQEGVTDNFILHIVQEYSIHAPMLSVSHSFDTFDNSATGGDNNTIDISHA